MTSLPIIFYALFDFEYEKGNDEDLDNPKLPENKNNDDVEIVGSNNV